MLLHRSMEEFFSLAKAGYENIQKFGCNKARVRRTKRGLFVVFAIKNKKPSQIGSKASLFESEIWEPAKPLLIKR